MFQGCPVMIDIKKQNKTIYLLEKEKLTFISWIFLLLLLFPFDLISGK